MNQKDAERQARAERATQGLKAYHATEVYWEESACVVFAETAGAAKSMASGELGVPFEEVRVRRAKEFDDYDHVPTFRELVEGFNWWVACQKCGGHCTNEETLVWDETGQMATCGECL